MKKLFILVLLVLVGCSNAPRQKDYQALMDEPVESPFFKVPPLNQKDFAERTWILLAESKSKLWFYDPYTLTEDEEGVVAFDAFFSPREQNNLQLFNATIVGPYRQKIDCFGNHQWSETLYTKNLPLKDPNLVDAKPVNGSGWVKIKSRTAMAYVRTRVCGRKFIDDPNVNYFLFQTGPIEKTSDKSSVFYEVINNEVTVIDAKSDVRQMKLSSYLMEKDFPKQADYLFTANCQSNTYGLVAQGAGEKVGGAKEMIGAKDSLAAVAFNRACGNHGAYMRMFNLGSR